jgi:hypothetical protein
VSLHVTELHITENINVASIIMFPGNDNMFSHTHPVLESVRQSVLRRSPAIGHEPVKMKKEILDFTQLYVYKSMSCKSEAC